MPSRRTKRAHKARTIVTPVLRDMYQEIKPLKEKHHADIRGEAELSMPERERMLELGHALRRGLNIKPADWCPWDVSDGEPWDNNRDSWRRAQELKRELETR